MKWLHYLLWFVLATLISIMVFIWYCAFLYFYPFKTLVINNFSYTSPIEIQNTVVHPGDTIYYKLSYCKYADLPATVYKTLVDGQKITLTEVATNAPVGCYANNVGSTVIPETINPGRYYLDVAVDYQVNFLQHQRIRYYTDYFNVVPMDVATSSVVVSTTTTSSIPHPILNL